MFKLVVNHVKIKRGESLQKVDSELKALSCIFIFQKWGAHILKHFKKGEFNYLLRKENVWFSIFNLRLTSKKKHRSTLIYALSFVIDAAILRFT